MATSVNWITGVITIPRADMTLVQSVPFEIRELNIDAFRLELRDLEDDPDGRPWSKTHKHETETTFSGITYARKVIFLAPYTFTFEDGNYAVNLVGANTNMADRVNLNQVSVRPTNSAGLINVREVQIGTYDGGITYDAINGAAGQGYPFGNNTNPTDNLADAIFNQALLGLPKVLYVIGDLDAGAGDALDGWKIIGVSSANHVHLDPGSDFANMRYHDLHIHGDLYGISQMHDCEVGHVNGFSGELHRCTLEDTVEVTPGLNAKFFGCYSEGVATINCGGAAADVNIKGHSGDVLITNVTSGVVDAVMIGGDCTVDPTVTGGSVTISDRVEFSNQAGTGATVIAHLQVADFHTLHHLVEMMRKTHQATGEIFYFDPGVGSSSFNGGTRDTAKPTLAEALALCVSGRGDMIIGLNQAGVASHAENVIINKDNVHLHFQTRLPMVTAVNGGTIMQIGDTDGTNGYGCSVSGVLLDGKRGEATAAAHAIEVYGKFSLLDAVWAKQTEDSTVKYHGGDYHVILDAEWEKSDTHILETVDSDLPSGSPREITIAGRSNMYIAQGDIIHLGADAGDPLGSTTRIIRVLEGNLTGATGYAIHADAKVDQLLIGKDVLIHGNNGGHGFPQLNILTDSYHNEKEEEREAQTDAVWAQDISATPGAEGTAGRILLDSGKILRNKVVTDPVAGTITVYDDDDSVLFTAPIWENVAGTTAYQGNAVNRKERLS